MILIINICKNELHTYEFVKPIEDILIREEKFFVTKHYSALTKKDISDAHRIIIAGTSLQDFDYEKDFRNHPEKFSFIDKSKKPILAICGGMQLLCMVHGCKLINGQEIGLVEAKFPQEFLGLKGKKEIYCLHNMTVKDDAALKKEFVIYGTTKYVQAVKHKKFPHYGLLFHPEVRNKDMIVKFLSV